jgi:hypothetical protein
VKSVYRVLAYLVALEVAVQAATIAFAVFGLTRWIDDGGVLDAAAVQSGETMLTGVVGFMVHGLNGQMIVPMLALLLLGSSFFAKVPGGIMWAALVLVTVVLQVLSGTFAHGLPELGIVHGVLAIALFAFALIAARRAGTAAAPVGETPTRGTTGVA